MNRAPTRRRMPRAQLVATMYLRAPNQVQAVHDDTAGGAYWMTTLHLDALERVARAAADLAPGRWTAFWLGWWRYAIAAPTQAIASYVEQPLARHIALVDPPTVLALVAELRMHRTRAALAAYQVPVGSYGPRSTPTVQDARP